MTKEATADPNGGNAVEKPDTELGFFETTATFSEENGESVVNGVMLEPGTFNTSRGPRIVTPDFIKNTMSKWVGARMCVVDASHPDKPPVTVDVARITKATVNAQGQGIYQAKPFKTTLAKDTWELAREYGRLGVSIDGPITVAADRKTMLDITPRYLAVLPMGDQAIPGSYAEVGKFSAAAGAFDSFNPEVKDVDSMNEQEIQALKDGKAKAEADVAKFSGEVASLTKELTAVKAERDSFVAAKDEAERVKLLDENAKFAKKFGDKEPASDAKLGDLRALRAAFADKALAKFSEESKAGAEVQKTAPAAPGNKGSEGSAPKGRGIMIVD